MKAAAANTGAGPAMAFMGMGMAGQAGGMNAQNLFQMGQQQQQMQQAAQPALAPAMQGWTCSCGQSGITGNFCPNCGSKKPEPKSDADSWKCICGATVNGKFCPECGSPRPAPAVEGWTCSCGAVNKGKFCSECGAKKSLPAYLSISVTSAAGSRLILGILRNSAPSAAIPLTMGISWDEAPDLDLSGGHAGRTHSFREL